MSPAEARECPRKLARPPGQALRAGKSRCSACPWRMGTVPEVSLEDGDCPRGDPRGERRRACPGKELAGSAYLGGRGDMQKTGKAGHRDGKGSWHEVGQKHKARKTDKACKGHNAGSLQKADGSGIAGGRAVPLEALDWGRRYDRWKV